MTFEQLVERAAAMVLGWPLGSKDKANVVRTLRAMWGAHAED
jgi:hypothetical protein